MINVGKELFSWIPVIYTSTFSQGSEQRHFFAQHRNQLRYLGGQTVKRLLLRPARKKNRKNPAQKKSWKLGKKCPPSQKDISHLLFLGTLCLGTFILGQRLSLPSIYHLPALFFSPKVCDFFLFLLLKNCNSGHPVK